jgi:hypothetical protein
MQLMHGAGTAPDKAICAVEGGDLVMRIDAPVE